MVGSSQMGETKTRRRLGCGDARLASAKSGETGRDGLHGIVSLYFFRPIWPVLYIARSVPVFDSRLALIFKGFLLTPNSKSLPFRIFATMPSDHPDGIGVIP
jgi:hypothetical protein